MADGTYCDYSSQMEPNMLPQLSQYGHRSSSENLGDGQQSKGGGPGFYMEHFPPGMPTTMQDAAMGMMGMSSHSGNTNSQQEALLAASMMSQAAAAGMFENVMNFAMKPEKGLPPTPPGSPDDPKEVPSTSQSQHQGYHSNMHPASMVAMQSPVNHNLLAKPVPMRRLSEKRIAQARASLGPYSSEPSIEHTLGSDQTNSSPALACAIAAVQQVQKRPRSEKKAIPTDLKDDKYFERRKRNNNAAKKSRDSRKAREDEIAIRASFLEKENAILRAQVTTLREEANSLRQLLLQKRSRH